jgi:anti-sigma B factor antagonist
VSQRLSKQPGAAPAAINATLHGRAPRSPSRPVAFYSRPNDVVATTDLEQSAEPVVVRLPAKIDLLSAERVGEQLCAAFTLGAAVVIADLSSTLFCDSAGIRQFVLAHNYANAHGAQMRFVVPERNILSVLMMTGLDRFLSVYPSLEAALSARPAPDSDAASA